MWKKSYLMLSIMLSVLFVVSSCKKDEDNDPINEAKVLAEYLDSKKIVDQFPAMIKSTDVNNSVLADDGNVYVIDIRDANTFAAGHVKGAVNVPLADVLKHYEDNDLSSKQTVAIVCFSGQSASFACGLLRMLGYDNVKAMKWGMCSWNANTSGSWKDIPTTGSAYSNDMVTAAADKNAEGELPVLNTGKTTAEEILRARVEAIFADWSNATVKNTDAVPKANNYYIVNYWIKDHYDVGHIDGAIQYTPKESLTYATDIKTLPTEKPVIVYCYTGQTSAHLAAYLRVLGYDAKTLLFGANGMMYDKMKTAGDMTIFKSSEIQDYDLATK